MIPWEIRATAAGRKSKASPVTTIEPDGKRRKREPKNYKVLVFDASMRLKGIHPPLKDTARLYNLRAEAINKLCKIKRPSQETGSRSVTGGKSSTSTLPISS